MLHDFGVCPGLCSKTMLNNCISSLVQPGQLPSIHYQATSKLSQSEAVISFHSFQKVLPFMLLYCALSMLGYKKYLMCHIFPADAMGLGPRLF
jgi:hypothetical protein